MLNFVRRCAALLLALTAVSGGPGLSVLDAFVFHRAPTGQHAATMDDAGGPIAHRANCSLAVQLPAWLPGPAIADTPVLLAASAEPARPFVVAAAASTTSADQRCRAPPQI